MEIKEFHALCQLTNHQFKRIKIVFDLNDPETKKSIELIKKTEMKFINYSIENMKNDIQIYKLFDSNMMKVENKLNYNDISDTNVINNCVLSNLIKESYINKLINYSKMGNINVKIKAKLLMFEMINPISTYAIYMQIKNIDIIQEQNDSIPYNPQTNSHVNYVNNNLRISQYPFGKKRIIHNINMILNKNNYKWKKNKS